jgi:hypothetical protein
VKKRAIRKFPYTIHADSGLPNKITTQIRTYIWMALVRQCCTGSAAQLCSWTAGQRVCYILPREAKPRMPASSFVQRNQSLNSWRQIKKSIVIRIYGT